MRISAVINTRNEERYIARCLKSISPYVDEIVIVDMHSTDKTRSIVRQYTRKIYLHEPVPYVEPARNFAISKASGDWILVLDPDEVVPETLGLLLRRLTSNVQVHYVRIPRKNILFGKWIQHTGWWPDYQVRFFKKGAVTWKKEIHSIPITFGKGIELTPKLENALIHYNYSSISEFLAQVDRYGNETAAEEYASGKAFEWPSLMQQPAEEFIRRFFVWEGYKDGVHGLALSLLQAVSLLVVELKLWEKNKFVNETPDKFLTMWWQVVQKKIKETKFWYYTKTNEQNNGLEKVFNKIRVKTGL